MAILELKIKTYTRYSQAAEKEQKKMVLGTSISNFETNTTYS